MKPLVSIIIPVYNGERFIKRALLSLVGQTYENIEIIVVDDGSSDRTSDIVGTFQDSRISFLHQENQGQGGARNNGIRSAKGSYITFLDADDQYLPTKVQKQVEFLCGNPEYKVAYCNALFFYSKNPQKLFKFKHKYPSGDIFRDLLRAAIINPNTIMLDRQIFRDGLMFNEGRRMRNVEDWDLYLQLSRGGFKFGYLDADLVIVESREESSTGSWGAQLYMKEAVVEMFEALFARMSERERVLYEADKVLKRHKINLAVAYLVNNDKQAFVRVVPNLVSLPFSLLLKAVVYVMPSELLRRALIKSWKVRRNWSAHLVDDGVRALRI